MSEEHNILVHGETLHKRKAVKGDWLLYDKAGNVRGFLRRHGSRDWRGECAIGDRFVAVREETLMECFYAIAWKAARRANRCDVKGEKHSADWLRDRLKREGIIAESVPNAQQGSATMALILLLLIVAGLIALFLPERFPEGYCTSLVASYEACISDDECWQTRGNWASAQYMHELSECNHRIARGQR